VSATHTAGSAAAALPTNGNDGWARRRARISGEVERAALELFAQHGPDNVTVELISQRAGISVRTFFRYFRTRDDIMFALPRRLVDDLCDRVAARPATESVLDAFINAVRDAQEASIDDDLVRLWGRAMRRWATAQAEPQPTAPMVVAYSEVIAARRGATVDDTRVEVMATAIASVMWLAFLRWLSADTPAALATVVEESFTVLGELDRPASG
jgi:TetR/AcrR family transcriptional regulator, regulator of mycofactocin system